MDNFFAMMDFEHLHIYEDEKYIFFFLIKIINAHNFLLSIFRWHLGGLCRF